MRSRLGYRFEPRSHDAGPQYALPGLWFSAEEIHALLTMQHLLSNLDTGGLLGGWFTVLMVFPDPQSSSKNSRLPDFSQWTLAT